MCADVNMHGQDGKGIVLTSSFALVLYEGLHERAEWKTHRRT
jgi:hypothetical protein